MIVEKSDDTVSSIKLDNRTFSGSLKNNNASIKNFTNHSDLEVDDTNDIKNAMMNSDRKNVIANRCVNLESDNFVNRDAVVRSNDSSNCSLGDSPITGSVGDCSPNNFEANDEPEPLSLVLDDLTDAEDLQQNLEDELYDYDKFNVPLASLRMGVPNGKESEEDEEIATLTHDEETKGNPASPLKDSKCRIGSPNETILGSNDTMDNVTSEFASFCISDDNHIDIDNDVDVNTFTISESDKSENLHESNTINSFADFSFDFDREAVEEKSSQAAQEFVNKIVDWSVSEGVNPTSTSRNGASPVYDFSNKFDMTEFGDFPTLETADGANEIEAESPALPESDVRLDCDFSNFEESRVPIASGDETELAAELTELSLDATLPPTDPFVTDVRSSVLMGADNPRSTPTDDRKEKEIVLGDDDFGDFADFSNEPADSGGNEWATNVESSRIERQSLEDDEDDDFQDFADFDSCVLPVEKPQISLKESISRIENKNVS